MSLCGICYAKIEDGEPFDEEHLSYDGCEEVDGRYYSYCLQKASFDVS